MKFSECKKLIESIYMTLAVYTTNARDVTLMIVAHESGGGKHRRQVGAAKPALGLGQMEEPTFNDVMKYSDRIKGYLKKMGYNPDTVKFSDLENDDTLAIIFIRARLAMDLAPLPSTPQAQAEFCKRFWNAGGKATPEKYLTDYQRWKQND
jgi:hypothetical protein